MPKVETLTLDQAAEELNTTVDEIKLMTKREQLDVVFIDGEALVTKQSVMDLQGEPYDEPEIISGEEAAEILGLSHSSVYAYGKSGKIKERDGGYDKQSVLKYKAQRDNSKRPLRTVKADAIPGAKPYKEDLCDDVEEAPKNNAFCMDNMQETCFVAAEEEGQLSLNQENINLIRENAYLKGKLDVIERIYPELKGVAHGII